MCVCELERERVREEERVRVREREREREVMSAIMMMTSGVSRSRSSVSGLWRKGVGLSAYVRDTMKLQGITVSGRESFMREMCSSAMTSVYGMSDEMDERLTKSQRRNRMRRHKQRTKMYEELEQMRIASSETYDSETLASELPVRDRVFNARLLRAVETALGGMGSSGGGGGRRSGAGRVSHNLSSELGFCVEEVRVSSKRERAYIRYGCLPGREERTEACVQSKYV